MGILWKCWLHKIKFHSLEWNEDPAKKTILRNNYLLFIRMAIGFMNNNDQIDLPTKWCIPANYKVISAVKVAPTTIIPPNFVLPATTSGPFYSLDIDVKHIFFHFVHVCHSQAQKFKSLGKNFEVWATLSKLSILNQKVLLFWKQRIKENCTWVAQQQLKFLKLQMKQPLNIF